MKLRQTLAMGAVSALIAPAFAVLTAPAALAGTTPASPSIVVNTPSVVGAGGHAIEFDARITGLGEREADLVFTLLEVGEFFRAHQGLADDLLLEYLDNAGQDNAEWKKVDFPKFVIGERKPTFKLKDEVFTGDSTLRMRVSVAGSPEPAPSPTPTPSPTVTITDAPTPAALSPGARKARAQVRNRAAQQIEKLAETPERKLPALRPCDTVQRGFTLGSELRPHQADEPEDQSKAASEEPAIASHEAKVEVGLPSIDMQGLDGSLVAGGQSKQFKVTVCNPTDSAYSKVFPGLAFGSFDTAAKVDAKDLTLEMSKESAGKFAPVKLEAVTVGDRTLILANFELADGITLQPRKPVTGDFRIAAASSAKIGEWGAHASVELPATPKVVPGFDRAEFQVVAAGPGQPTSSPSTTPGQHRWQPDGRCGRYRPAARGCRCLLGGAPPPPAGRRLIRPARRPVSPPAE
jgi:hypothetical protein